MKQALADIATNEKQRLNGFRVLGVFPFHLKYITTGTHIKLCKIRAKIQEVMKDKEPQVNDFYNPEIQEKVIPYINDYVVTALLNDRLFSFIFKPFLKIKVRECGHLHILNLYTTILKLDEPAFFLSYWKWILNKDNTLLKEAKQS